ncbi:hypothetical protein D623_10029906 [Myotis brandtii]|uniref:Uncharacterized protein n=1 Tax=Myotis brandtii TaxID=109478 RepID=S7MUN6_MYOBR|nr:hypothetical protein D623_10029906 [Myotis brandtii]
MSARRDRRSEKSGAAEETVWRTRESRKVSLGGSVASVPDADGFLREGRTERAPDVNLSRAWPCIMSLCPEQCLAQKKRSTDQLTDAFQSSSYTSFL